jgi:hypothetical protein
MSSTLKALFHMQGGECFYCGRPTWLKESGEGMRVAMSRLGVVGRRALIRREASREHLLRRADGGTGGMHNYVMSCKECNSARQATPVLLHFGEMRSKYAASAS